MILSLTPNTTLDLTVFVPRLETHRTIRATRTVYSMGGKPTDASYILGRRGIGSLALGLAAGAVGEKVAAMLRELGVTVDFIEVAGETRINTVIVDEAAGEHTTITSASMQVRPADVAALLARYEQALSQASVVITGGSLPPGMTPGFYADAIKLANERGLPVIFDAAPPNLQAGLHARPAFVKPNQDELSALVGEELRELAEIYRAARDIQAKYETQVVVTLGEAGALAVLAGRSYRIPPIPVAVSSPAGAGDAVLAGLAQALQQNLPIEDGLRLGIAAASAVCLQPGTAAYEVADMQRFLPLVELIPYPWQRE
ncbi:MAG: 1-phosphofructokinase family hexose kinase [Chloroflexi bacterium]|nr:1-phosphofructokinase family hexose kinase [Chloroflexota bacterium]MCY3582258.1 1-phosphofructokinase family hexose kinase [Chloroflexota bacterium]MCY3717158.1 1-phosphofructokinase family hexose kinase [Chloroflexota bacterium]MDE2651719.1 1-phosphofructokinase family hexose kinase [Chloroflexota bacterium]MXV92775.1 1-phosphofructokinase family hexose kinase [Chloroflexota bacterium]